MYLDFYVWMFIMSRWLSAVICTAASQLEEINYFNKDRHILLYRQVKIPNLNTKCIPIFTLSHSAFQARLSPR